MNVIQRQDAIEVFQNDDGGITIRQEDSYGESSVVWFSIDHAEKLASAILQICSEIKKGE